MINVKLLKPLKMGKLNDERDLRIFLDDVVRSYNEMRLFLQQLIDKNPHLVDGE